MNTWLSIKKFDVKDGFKVIGKRSDGTWFQASNDEGLETYLNCSCNEKIGPCDQHVTDAFGWTKEHYGN